MSVDGLTAPMLGVQVVAVSNDEEKTERLDKGQQEY